MPAGVSPQRGPTPALGVNRTRTAAHFPDVAAEAQRNEGTY